MVLLRRGRGREQTATLAELRDPANRAKVEQALDLIARGKAFAARGDPELLPFVNRLSAMGARNITRLRSSLPQPIDFSPGAAVQRAQQGKVRETQETSMETQQDSGARRFFQGPVPEGADVELFRTTGVTDVKPEIQEDSGQRFLFPFITESERSLVEGTQDEAFTIVAPQEDLATSVERGAFFADVGRGITRTEFVGDFVPSTEFRRAGERKAFGEAAFGQVIAFQQDPESFIGQEGVVATETSEGTQVTLTEQFFEGIEVPKQEFKLSRREAIGGALTGGLVGATKLTGAVAEGGVEFLTGMGLATTEPGGTEFKGVQFELPERQFQKVRQAPIGREEVIGAVVLAAPAAVLFASKVPESISSIRQTGLSGTAMRLSTELAPLQIQKKAFILPPGDDVIKGVVDEAVIGKEVRQTFRGKGSQVEFLSGEVIGAPEVRSVSVIRDGKVALGRSQVVSPFVDISQGVRIGTATQDFTSISRISPIKAKARFQDQQLGRGFFTDTVTAPIADEGKIIFTRGAGSRLNLDQELFAFAGGRRQEVFFKGMPRDIPQRFKGFRFKPVVKGIGRTRIISTGPTEQVGTKIKKPPKSGTIQVEAIETPQVVTEQVTGSLKAFDKAVTLPKTELATKTKTTRTKKPGASQQLAQTIEQLSSQRTSAALAPALGLSQKVMEKQSSRAAVSLASVNRVAQQQGQAQFTIPKLKTGLKTRTETKLRSSFSVPVITTGGFGFTPPPGKFLLGPPGFFPGFGFDERPKGTRKGKRKFKRRPSLIAAELNIRSPKPSKAEITGLVVRPIVT